MDPFLMPFDDGNLRCKWCAATDGYRAYHDEEWGRPVADDRRLFEKIVLEGFQAGLSWRTILEKREGFRKAFSDFDFDAIARYRRDRVERLVVNPAIVRHRGKIESTINNARRARALVSEFGSLAAYFWRFEPAPDARPAALDGPTLMALTTSPEATALSKDLKRRGWTFVGPTTVYAFMQAMGLVNDHVEGCAFRASVEAARAGFRRPR